MVRAVNKRKGLPCIDLLVSVDLHHTSPVNGCSGKCLYIERWVDIYPDSLSLLPASVGFSAGRVPLVHSR